MDLGIDGLGHATEVGAGASAIVYRARQLDLDREVAVKVLTVTDEAFVRRFKREAKTLGKLSQNQGIVTVYDTGVTGAGHPYLILELCEASLLDLVKTEGPFEPHRACRTMAQVADAVAAAHRGGVIHRDLKPGNVLLSSLGRYMVTDFGISTVTGATMGQTSSVGFTAGYVAPETLTGEDAGTPADVYALGATLFHIVSGRAPFIDPDKSSNLLALAQRVINDPVPDLRGEGVPDGICRVIEQAMAKDPTARPTAAELAVLLRDVADGRPPDLSAVTGDGAAADGEAGPVVADVNATVADAPGVATDEAAQEAQKAEKADPAADAGETSLDLAPIEAAVMSAAASDATAVVGEPVPPPTSRSADGGFGGPATSTGGAERMAAHGVPGRSDTTTGRPTPAAHVPGFDHDRRYRYTQDDRRSVTSVVVGAMLTLAVLAGLTAFFLLRDSGTDEADAGGDTEIVAGPETGRNDSGSFGGDGGTAFGQGSNTLAPRPVDVPDVVGLDAGLAEQRLAAAGLEPNLVERASSSVPIGRVISTDPAAGTEARTGDTVTVFVSDERPAETVAIPRVTGRTRAAAEAALRGAGLRWRVMSQETDGVDPGTALGTVPPSGTTVNVGATVELWVATGPVARSCADQVGLTESAATANLEDDGLTVSVSPRLDATVPVGRVISCTRPTASTATLVVSADPDALCDQAVGRSLASATTLLEGAGLDVSSTPTANSDVPNGEVFSCTISGTSATLRHASNSTASCPAVSGLSEDAAREALTEAGFTTITTSLQNSSTVEEGRVISCSATGPTTADLVLSSGPGGTVVPEVAGQTVASATTEIESFGLTVRSTSMVESQQPEGIVVGTTPSAGTQVPPRSSVELLVSKGPPAGVTVPIVVGSTPAQATATLQAVGLAVVVSNNEVGPGASGLVSSQSPTAGQVVPPGSTVTIVVDVVGTIIGG